MRSHLRIIYLEDTGLTLSYSSSLLYCEPPTTLVGRVGLRESLPILAVITQVVSAGNVAALGTWIDANTFHHLGKDKHLKYWHVRPMPLQLRRSCEAHPKDCFLHFS